MFSCVLIELKKRSQLQRIQVDRTSHLLGTVYHILATEIKG